MDTTTNEYKLKVTFQEVGVGSNSTVNYALTFATNVTWGCVNAHNGKAGGHRTIAGVDTGIGSGTADGRGNVRGTVYGNASSLVTIPPTNLSCNSQETLELMYVQYTAITLTDATHGISVGVNDTSNTKLY